MWDGKGGITVRANQHMHLHSNSSCSWSRAHYTFVDTVHCLVHTPTRDVANVQATGGPVPPGTMGTFKGAAYPRGSTRYMRSLKVRTSVCFAKITSTSAICSVRLGPRRDTPPPPPLPPPPPASATCRTVPREEVPQADPGGAATSECTPCTGTPHSTSRCRQCMRDRCTGLDTSPRKQAWRKANLRNQGCEQQKPPHWRASNGTVD